MPSNTAASIIGYSVISLLWQLPCYCNPDHNKFSSLSNTTVVAIFPNLCLWRRSFCSNLGDIDPEKLYRATLKFARKCHCIISRYINNNLCLHTVQNTFYNVFYIPYISAPIALQLIRSLTSTYCIVAGGSGKYSF